MEQDYTDYLGVYLALKDALETKKDRIHSRTFERAAWDAVQCLKIAHEKYTLTHKCHYEAPNGWSCTRTPGHTGPCAWTPPRSFVELGKNFDNGFNLGKRVGFDEAMNKMEDFMKGVREGRDKY